MARHVKAYFPVGEADKRPSDDKSRHDQEQSRGAAQVLDDEGHGHDADAGTGVQDTA